MKHYSGDQTNKNEIGRACGVYGDRRGAYRVWWGDLREIDNLEDLSVDRRTILKWIFNKVGWGGMEWIALAQDRHRWR
jgi:hypothetical protein